MEYQLSFSRGQPDDEAIKQLQYYEGLALEMDSRGYAVCSSEGKDSRVLGHLFRRSGVKHFYFHSITGIDPPELVYFQRRNFQAYHDAGYSAYDSIYRKSIWRLMEQKLIPPMRQFRYCCAELKERRSPVTEGCLLSFGVRKLESVSRAHNRDELEIVAHGRRGKNLLFSFDNDGNRRTFEVCYAKCEKRLNPLAYWPDEWIWEYSRDVKLEQCALYAEGFSRLGCIGCPMARTEIQKMEFRRWPGFERLWRGAFDRMFQRRVELGKSNLHSSGQEWFEHWLSGDALKFTDADQLIIENYNVFDP